MRSLVLRPEPPTPQRPLPPVPTWVPWPHKVVATCSLGVAVLHLIAACLVFTVSRATSESTDLVVSLLGHMWARATPFLVVMGVAWLITALGLRRGRTWGLVGTVVLLLIQLSGAVVRVMSIGPTIGHVMFVTYPVIMLIAIVLGLLQIPPHRRGTRSTSPTPFDSPGSTDPQGSSKPLSDSGTAT
jgi:hypothetical protein